MHFIPQTVTHLYISAPIVIANRLGGDGISGPSAVPQSGANPGIRKRSFLFPARPVMDATP